MSLFAHRDEKKIQNIIKSDSEWKALKLKIQKVLKSTDWMPDKEEDNEISYTTAFINAKTMGEFVVITRNENNIELESFNTRRHTTGKDLPRKHVEFVESIIEDYLNSISQNSPNSNNISHENTEIVDDKIESDPPDQSPIKNHENLTSCSECDSKLPWNVRMCPKCGEPKASKHRLGQKLVDSVSLVVFAIVFWVSWSYIVDNDSSVQSITKVPQKECDTSELTVGGCVMQRYNPYDGTKNYSDITSLMMNGNYSMTTHLEGGVCYADMHVRGIANGNSYNTRFSCKVR